MKLPKLFWIGLRKLGIEPASVLRHARVPLTHWDDEKLVTTAQWFSIGRAIGDLSNDPGIGLKLGSQLQPAARPPSLLAARFARDYRDALRRIARFKQLCVPSEMYLTERRDECVIEGKWIYAVEEEPPTLTDMSFAALVEMGRRGTEQPLNPKRIELKQPPELTGVHRAYFNCPVKFRAGRNVLIIDAADLDRPFVTYNAALLEMLQPQLEKGLEQQRADASISEQVKWIVRRMLAGGHPDASAIAQELGLSIRTLQRRIVEEGRTFRGLLEQARKELVHEY
jgi:hypothetical protein